MCDPLQSDSVDIACSYQGKNVSCESKMMPRTKATLACKPFYTISTSSGIVYKRINCQEGGLWDRPMYHCNPGKMMISYHTYNTENDVKDVTLE